jgi:hypothetical protein
LAGLGQGWPIQSAVVGGQAGRQVVGQAAGVAEQGAEGHPTAWGIIAGGGGLGQILPQGSVEIERAGIGQPEHGQGGGQLADGGHREKGLGGQGAPGGVGACGQEFGRPCAAHHGDDHAGHYRTAEDLLNYGFNFCLPGHVFPFL